MKNKIYSGIPKNPKLGDIYSPGDIDPDANIPILYKVTQKLKNFTYCSIRCDANGERIIKDVKVL